MKAENALKEAVEILKKSSIASPFLDARIILAHILSCSAQDIILKYSEREIPLEQYHKYLLLIEARASRIPLSHIINRREFYGNIFYVDKNVLDPRPDSETMIEMIIEKYQNTDLSLNICEVGCGSGCLTISLLKFFKNWCAVALDLSPSALEICKINAEKNGAKDQMDFLLSDIFSSLNKKHCFDIIISNPPYIPSNDIDNLQDEVRLHEPRMALDGGLDGLDFYRKIAQNCTLFLKKNGKIFLEIGHNQFESVKEIFESNSMKLIDFKKDLNGIIRILEFAN